MCCLVYINVNIDCFEFWKWLNSISLNWAWRMKSSFTTIVNRYWRAKSILKHFPLIISLINLKFWLKMKLLVLVFSEPSIEKEYNESLEHTWCFWCSEINYQDTGNYCHAGKGSKYNKKPDRKWYWIENSWPNENKRKLQ